MIPPPELRGSTSIATRSTFEDIRPDEVDAAGRRGGCGSSGKNFAVGVLIDSQQVHFPPRRQLHGFNRRVTVRIKTDGTNAACQHSRETGCNMRRFSRSEGSRTHLRWVLCGRVPRGRVSLRGLRDRWGVCERRVPLQHRRGVQLLSDGEGRARDGTDVEPASLRSRTSCERI